MTTITTDYRGYTNLDPFDGLETVPAQQLSAYIAERVRAQMRKSNSPAVDIYATGLECLEDSPEKVFLSANPSLKAAVDAGRMTLQVKDGKTSIALAGWGSGRLAKLHIPIDCENGSHLEDFAKLEAQLKLIQEQVDRPEYSILKEALEAGRAEIRMDHGNLGIHVSGKHAWPHQASGTAEKLAKSYTPMQAHIAKDDAVLSDSIGF